MAIEWVLFFLPVVFILGWLAARLDIRHIKKNASRLPRAYMTGLSHLVRGEKDQALDAFIKAQPIAPESFDLRFAIAELSRHRGEHRRALEVHKEISEREDLPDDVRKKALWELAKDYFNMGFLDYAEHHATPLMKDKEYHERALEMMLTICQLSGDYRRALTFSGEFSDSAALFRRVMRAQWHCQCAASLADDKREEKRKLLEDALHINNKCARASMMLGNLALAEGRTEEAASYFLSVERQGSEYLWRAVEGLVKARTAQGRTDVMHHEVLRWFHAYPSSALFESAYRAFSTLPEGGNSLAREALLKRLGVTVGMRWIDEQSASLTGEDRDLWMALRETLRAAAGKRFFCDNCGYEVDDFFWQCSGCLYWESCRLRENGHISPPKQIGISFEK
ncbi:MAG: hypothetical protein R1F54_02035 [Candidatus Zeuxoniibacter abyssi]|nr:MAG: hypothetical protein R1F54_02035 [Candidatus Persebacteraceae bacterium AB1(2)]